MMDFILEAWVSTNIERAKARWMLGGGHFGRLSPRADAWAVGRVGANSFVW